MLTIRIGAEEVFDDATEEFKVEGGVEVQMEHSLVSLSKWESIHEKPFLGNDHSPEEAQSYILCMLVTENPPEDFLHKLSQDNVLAINRYIDAKRTATWFSETSNAPSTRREVITSELIYYWMTAFNIDFECQHWHLSRLFTLIRICNMKQEKPKKMSRSEIAARNRELNAQRKAQFGTSG